MAFRFLHIADLHLETAFGGRPETRARLAEATLEAFQNAVDRALELELDALLIAGDAFDHDKFSLAAQRFFLSELERLVRGGVHVFYVTGNHDPGLKRGKAANLGFTEAPEQVGPQAGLWLYRRAQPQTTCVLDRDGEPLAYIVGAGHIDEQVSTNLAAKFQRPDTPLPVVGLLHTQVEAARISDAHATYAPSEREDFERAQLDYWALGHVHLRQQVFDHLPVYYSGNLQGRNPRETGEKGGLLVELESGETPRVRPETFGPVLWLQHECADLDAITHRDGLLEHLAAHIERLAEEHTWLLENLCVRLRPTGVCPVARMLLQADVRQQIELDLETRTDCREIQIRPGALRAERDLTELEGTPSVQREALLLLRAMQTDDSLLLELAPRELPGADALGASTPAERLAYLRARLENMEEELLRRTFREEAWS